MKADLISSGSRIGVGDRAAAESEFLLKNEAVAALPDRFELVYKPRGESLGKCREEMDRGSAALIAERRSFAYFRESESERVKRHFPLG